MNEQLSLFDPNAFSSPSKNNIYVHGNTEPVASVQSWDPLRSKLNLFVSRLGKVQ